MRTVVACPSSSNRSEAKTKVAWRNNDICQAFVSRPDGFRGEARGADEGVTEGRAGGSDRTSGDRGIIRWNTGKKMSGRKGPTGKRQGTYTSLARPDRLGTRRGREDMISGKRAV